MKVYFLKYKYGLDYWRTWSSTDIEVSYKKRSWYRSQ